MLQKQGKVYIQQLLQYLCSSFVAMRLDTFLKMPPPLSIMARVLVWLLYVRVLTKKAKAPGTVQISALFSVQCADRFQRALRTLFNVDSLKNKIMGLMHF